MSKSFQGIDVSHWQGDIDFKRVKESGIDFVIIKAGGSDGKTKKYYKDKMFETYYKDAKANGLNVGAYFYVGKDCNNSDEGFSCANYFDGILDGKQFEYPVFIDFEESPGKNKNGNTEATRVFCKYMESAGYFVGIYASDISGFKEKLNENVLTEFAHWVARYGRSPEYVKNFGIWQYTSQGKVSGIKGNVDLDISYVDYPSIIKKKGFNGF